MFDVLDVDAGSGLFSAPVIGAFLTASGWGGALVLWGSGASLAVASVAGVGSGVVLGYLAWWLTRAFMRMPTDETPRIGDLLGKEATVITRIPDSGYGEIRVRHLGQMMKLNARATEPITAGAAVVITQVLSASSVLVEPEATFFGTLSQEQEQ
jgi:membrane protein implicated in regulation of membrane protease activity